MKKYTKIISFAVFTWGIIFSQSASAQCDIIANECTKHLPTSYTSDGQLYRALLLNEEVAEFETTFFGGYTYRISACSGGGDGNLIFRLYDEKRNLLFSSSDYQNVPYWDFTFKSTMNCKIEGELNHEKLASGCAVFLIGFKQK